MSEKARQMEEKIIEFNFLNTKLQELEQQMQVIEKQISELQTTFMSLREIEEINKDTEMLASLGQNVFVKARLKENKEVFIDVGAKVFVKKSVEQAQDIMNKKTDEFIKLRENATKQVGFITEQLTMLQEELRKMQ